MIRLMGIFLAGALALSAASDDLERAQKLYDLTEFDQSLEVLNAIRAKDGPIFELIGRNYYMNGDFKKATEALEKAVEADPLNSDRVLWLARAYGRRAETSNFLSAMGHASKARQYFERAVQLNPRNLDALTDLLEYYLEAPGMMGGGIEKARATVVQISQVDPIEGDWAQAKLDEKSKQFGKAEAQLRRAVELAPHQVGKVIDLAKFLSRQGRYQEADQSFARAEQIAPNSPRVMYARADSYIQARRNLDTARELLQRYLSSPITPDDPPKQDARKLLRQIHGG